MPHLLAKILRAQEAVRVVEGAVPDEAHRALGEMLQSLEHQHAFLWVHSQDGGYQELTSNGFEAYEGGDNFIFGCIVGSGLEEWSGGMESYVLLNVPGEDLKKVFLFAVQKGYVGNQGNLLWFIRDAFTGDERLEECLARAGFADF